MGKCSALVVSLLSLLLLFSLRGYADPTYTSNQSQLITTYSPTNYSNFSITWNDSSGNVSAYLENNFTGSFTNISMFGSYPYYYYNSSILDANTYQYRFVANNSSGNEGSTPISYFTINKTATSINLFLNGAPENVNFLSNNTANFTVALNVSAKTVSLVSNYTGLNQSGSSPFSFNSGFYSVGNWWYLTGLFLGDEDYIGSNQTYYFNVTDSTLPTYNNNVESTHLAGYPSTFSTLWTDNAGLSGYIFSFNNGNGSFVNDSWVPMTGLTNWSNVTRTINSTAGSLIQWEIYANDTSNNWIVTSGNQFYAISIDGAACTADNQCLHNCVNNVCRQLNYCGDGYCDSGESCSFCPTDCGACQSTTTTTTSPSSGSPTPTGTFTIKDLASSSTISQGGSNSAQFTLSNNLQNNLASVSVTVSGIDSSWYTLSKNFISNLVHGSTQPITITFNIPDSAEAKDYNIAITAAGKDILTKLLKTYTATMTLTVNSSQPQPIAPIPSVTETPPETTSQDNNTANITSNQTSVVTGLAPAFEFFKSNLVIILAIAACLLIFIFRDNLTVALGGTLGKEEPEKTHKAKSVSPLKGIKDKLNYKLVVNLKKEGRTKSLKEPTKELGSVEKIPEMVPEKEPKRPAVLEKEIKRDIKELQSIIDNEKKVKNNKKKFDMNNN